MRLLTLIAILLWSTRIFAQDPFSHQLSSKALPWTGKNFDNSAAQFQFAIVSDRTGAHRPGVFGYALKKLNRMHPEFVMSVGDYIEGYTKDTSILEAEWMEFDSILNHLDMRFFALPGNHDITNDVMRDIWIERYGSAYYHFKYKDVLFLAFDSNDGDGVTFSAQQLDYFKNVLKENTDVRWTLLFMHHPIWNYREFNGFTEIEDLLKDRPYTVFAGHTHRYFKTIRQDRNYYLLATTGGGSRLRGPRMGEFDHVTWVTMTDQGPDLLHLQLSGMLEGDLLSEETAALANLLGQAAEIEHLVLSNKEGAQLIFFQLSNQFPEAETKNQPLRKELQFEGRFFHNHQLNPHPAAFTTTVPIDEVAQIEVKLSKLAEAKRDVAEDLELDYTLSFDLEDPMEPPFLLSGTKVIDLSATVKGIRLTEQNIFLDQHSIAISADFPEIPLHYTLDGTDPEANSPIYKQPIGITETTVVKVRYFSADKQYAGPILSKTYTRTALQPAAKVKTKNLDRGLTYQYYEGDFTASIPPFEQLSPKDQGVALSSAPNLIAEKNGMRLNHYAISFEGWIELPEDGVYTFYTSSDDGSILYLHGKEVVNNDGSHSNRSRQAFTALEKGWAPIRVDYFQNNQRQLLSIGMITPSGEHLALPFSNLWHLKK